MRFSPVSCEHRETMLRAVGATTIDGLFDVIPAAVRLEDGLDLGEGLTEIELDSHLRSLADYNEPATSLVSFLGAGCYDHYIPSVVDHVISRPEFFTAYTPYQPEVSQGTLQTIYEFQSMICALTGMDVANASMYDGATAFVEAALMAARVTKRHRVVCSPTVHPEWQNTLATYAEAGQHRSRDVPGPGRRRAHEPAATSPRWSLATSPQSWSSRRTSSAPRGPRRSARSPTPPARCSSSP